MICTGKTMAAVMPQISIAPQPPRSTTEKPSDPSRKPGFARQITNPSYQRSVFRSCRSSTTASATVRPPRWRYRSLHGNTGRAAERSTCGYDFQRARVVQSVRFAQAADYDQVRVRRGERCRLRRPLALREVWPLVEHAPDPGGGVRGPAAEDAAPQARGARDDRPRGGRHDPAGRRRQLTLHSARPDGDGRMALPRHPVVAAQVPPKRPGRAALAAPPRIAC